MKKNIGAKTITYPLPVYIVGSYDNDGKANIMTASWGGICCSEPPCIAVSIRKQRHSYDSIINNKAFTINIPSEDNSFAADFCGIYSGKDTDKFTELNLTPLKSEFVNAPFVDEFPVNLHCRLVTTNELGTHVQFIGEIIQVSVNLECLNEKDIPDIALIKPFLYDTASKSYYSVGSKIMTAYTARKDAKQGI